MQEQKLATLLVALADRSTLDWHGSKDFWKTVDEAKAMFGQRIVAVILSAETGVDDPKYFFLCAVTPEDDVTGTIAQVLIDAQAGGFMIGFAALDVTVASSVPNRDGILAWLDANGAQRMQ